MEGDGEREIVTQEQSPAPAAADLDTADGKEDEAKTKDGDKKKKRTWQKVNTVDFYNPKPYEAQKGGGKDRKGGGKDREGGGKGKGDRENRGYRAGPASRTRAEGAVEDGDGPSAADDAKAQGFIAADGSPQTAPGADSGGRGGGREGGKGRKDGKDGKDGKGGGKQRLGDGGKRPGGKGQGPGTSGPGGPGGPGGPVPLPGNAAPRGKGGGKAGTGGGPGGPAAPRAGQSTAAGSPPSTAASPEPPQQIGVDAAGGARPPMPMAGKGVAPAVPGVGMPLLMAPYANLGMSYPGMAAPYYPYGAMSAMYAMPYYAVPTTAPSSGNFMPSAQQLSVGPPSQAPTMPTMAPTTDRSSIVTQVQAQIEYYFGQENLIKDVFFRSKVMDQEGWVQIERLASFKMMQKRTTDMSIIMDAIKACAKLEINADGTAVRLKNDWEAWILPSSSDGASQPQA
mmetsp:Transcript_17534/g.30690  ORF Transcript_17534/g.30690 Transcript_17534/m.30690 type:complete len:453 (-) Transcript_17534:113-1471(-)|eukprot:CAMPEP_0197638306 /NCGR_PEP_ID=MMETSP1338-20131121/13276_1 /TAXON_ID=43686 ORGANISM="Pelagodinium beii, Strain RCC1491" /NCGR_SAMPLE_ID=MMETSP1338 /ASSEMBLY_ACC=CAM_ASM_000754 /LENGTH=452 /DNA_ID=CAMNT_0043210859 /DNA_START=105 /DNA_END=1463 /DNA_ORIENTATION=+